MNDIIDFVVRHGHPVIFGWVLLDQAGIPLPAVPLLLVIGALAGTGRLSLWLAVAVAMAGCLAADLLWYTFGRRRGAGVLGILCRITLEPDSCVRRTEELFVAHRLRSLVIAKFLPGLNPIAAALAGVVKIRLIVFVLCEVGGALAWALGWMCLGYLFSGLIEPIAAAAARLGGTAVVLVVGLLALYVAAKWIQRRRFFRELRMARITPENLKAMMDRGTETIIVDLRTSVAAQAMPYTIPGALRISPEELQRREREIPRDVEVVLYCT